MLGIVVLLAGVWVVSIHSGGGGVDLGAWSEEDHFTEELLRTSEAPESYETEGGDENFSLDYPRAETSYSSRIGPISVEGETGLLNTASSPETAGVGLDIGRERLLHSPSATTDPSSETHVYPTPNSPPGQFLPHRRRLTTNASQTRHSRVPSHSHSVMFSNSPVSPPLGSVSTLGTGFQIGLSPVSPGFTLVPRERRRRISGLGLGAPPSFADVVVEAMGAEERERRRTVSEGGIRDRVEMHQSEDSPVETVAEVGGRSEHHDNMDIRGHNSRWKWLKKVITGSQG